MSDVSGLGLGALGSATGNRVPCRLLASHNACHALESLWAEFAAWSLNFVGFWLVFWVCKFHVTLGLIRIEWDSVVSMAKRS